MMVITRIANELLEAVILAGLTQHQLLVFLAVMRKQYGFNKKLDWVSNEQLSELTGILPHKCSRCKKCSGKAWDSYSERAEYRH